MGGKSLHLCASRQILTITLFCILLASATQMCVEIWVMEAGAWIRTGLSPLKGQFYCVYFTSSVLQGVKDIEKREGKYPQSVVESASLTFLNSMSDMSATIPATFQV